uniref:6-phosphogluconolactonase n=1 Tax=Caenorhabditis tropicalis TaxID=1561998 RepID=A0A1I7V0R7_9PELO
MCLNNGHNEIDKPEMKPEVNVSADETELVAQLRRYLNEKLTYLLEQNGIVSIGVSGGSMPKVFTKAFLETTEELKNLNWKRIRIFMVDERNVEKDDDDSNLGAYLKLFPQELHEIFIPFTCYRDARHTAHGYEMNLRKYLFPEQNGTFARFDVVFLGVGPDGHTASLFPGKERLDKVTELHWVAAINDSPKPPASRITLTMQCLQNAKNVAFIITGIQKAEIVRGIWNRELRYPAAQARPYNEKLTLFLDEEAAKGIPERDSSDSESPPPFE